MLLLKHLSLIYSNFNFAELLNKKNEQLFYLIILVVHSTIFTNTALNLYYTLFFFLAVLSFFPVIKK